MTSTAPAEIPKVRPPTPKNKIRKIIRNTAELIPVERAIPPNTPPSQLSLEDLSIDTTSAAVDYNADLRAKFETKSDSMQPLMPASNIELRMGSRQPGHRYAQS